MPGSFCWGLSGPLTFWNKPNLFIAFVLITLHRMNEMQNTVNEMRGVCLSVSVSVCHAAQLGFTVQESFGAVFAKSLWSVVSRAHQSLG